MSGSTLGCHHRHLGGRGETRCRYSRMHRTVPPRTTKDYPSLQLRDAEEDCTGKVRELCLLASSPRPALLQILP